MKRNYKLHTTALTSLLQFHPINQSRHFTSSLNLSHSIPPYLTPYRIMAHLGTTNAAAQGIPWDQLIEFANNKKAEEQSTGKPAQLSKQQLAAVSMLVDFVKDIEVDDNYVSRLNGTYSPA